MRFTKSVGMIQNQPNRLLNSLLDSVPVLLSIILILYLSGLVTGDLAGMVYFASEELANLLEKFGMSRIVAFERNSC